MTLKTKSLILLLLATAAVCLHVGAQPLQATRSHYSAEDGLASNAISHMVQDDYGYIWIATWNGLSRFDGYNFFNHKTGAASHIAHLHNRVLSLAIDNQQNVWMRMYDGRVFVLRRSDDRIINPFEGITGSEELRTSYPIVVTSNGDVMVSIDDKGLYKLRLDQRGISSQLVTTSGLIVTSMAEGYQGDVWLGTNQGVHRLDAGNLTVERKGYFLDENITCLYSNGYNIFAATESGKILSFSYGQEPREIRSGGLPINALFVDTHDLVWFSDTRQGALRLDPATGDEKLFEQHVVSPDYDGKGGAFRETNGQLWVRMNHGGYGYYNRETDEVEYFHNDPSNPWNLSNTVSSSLELSEGVIWESTIRRGLEKLELLKNTITRTRLLPEATSSLDNETRALFYDLRHKTLIIGNKNSQLFLFPENGTPSVITTDDQGHRLGRIYGISQDAQGALWVSSKDYGLFRMTPRAQGGYTITNMQHRDGDPTSLSSNNAYATVEDTQGNIWVATYGSGVNVLPRGTSEFLSPGHGITAYPYNSYLKVRTLAVDRDGIVWAGTTDGILLLQLKDGKVDVQRLESSEKSPDNILLSGDVVCLARDMRGTMWVGTNGGGLAHTIGKDSEGRWLFENFGSADGLPSEEIRSITFDMQGKVWFATDHAICSYDPGKRIFSSFTSLDGVDETQCSEGAALTLPGGDILFGTYDGYYTVDRSKLVNTTGNMLKLRITDFWINDELQSPRLTDRYDYYIPESHSVELSSHNTMFSIRFASLNYQLQHRVHYQYKLEGYDNDWRTADNARTASYAGLPTGEYRFKVKAFLLESPEKCDVRAITIVVPPYFLLSRNAIWLYMAILAVVLLGLLFWRQKSLARKYGLRGQADGGSASGAPSPDAEASAQDEGTDAYELMDP